MAAFDLAADRGLVEAARRDPAAWRDIVVRHFDPIYRYCALRSADAQTAEHMAIAVFSHARASLERYDTSNQPLVIWLMSMAREQAQEQQAAGKAPLGLPAIPPQQAEAVQQVRRLLGTTEHSVAEALVLTLALGHSFDEIARLSGRSAAATKMGVYRTVAKVRRRLESEREG